MASVSLGPMVTSAAACTAGTPLPIATPVPARRSISRSAKSSPKVVIRSRTGDCPLFFDSNL